MINLVYVGQLNQLAQNCDMGGCGGRMTVIRRHRNAVVVVRQVVVRQVVVTGPRPLSRNRLLNEQPFLFGSNYPTSICNSEMSCPLPIGSVDCQCSNSRVSLAITTICYNECLYMYCSVRFFARAETNNHNHDCSMSLSS